MVSYNKKTEDEQQYQMSERITKQDVKETP